LLDGDPAGALAAFRTLQGAEAWRCHGQLVSGGAGGGRGSRPGAAPAGQAATGAGPLNGNPLGLGPGIASRFEVAATVTAEDEAAAGRQREAIAAAVRQATAGGWLVAQPAAAGPALPLGADADTKQRRRSATLTLAAPAGLAGAPVVVVPARPPGHPPLGLALVAAPGADATALAAATGGGSLPSR
jgi:hypothetical protein